MVGMLSTIEFERVVKFLFMGDVMCFNLPEEVNLKFRGGGCLIEKRS